MDSAAKDSVLFLSESEGVAAVVVCEEMHPLSLALGVGWVMSTEGYADFPRQGDWLPPQGGGRLGDVSRGLR